MRLKSLFFRSLKSDKPISGEIEILRKSPLLDPVWYRQNYPDLRDTPIDAARHYLEHGAEEGRNPHPLFDTKFYLEQNPDVAAAGMNPLVHYILHGCQEGRDPNPFFDTDWYLAQNPDIAGSDINPLVYYFTIGESQGHNPSPHFDVTWYLDNNPDIACAGAKPLEHFLQHGRSEGLAPSRNLDQDRLTTVTEAEALEILRKSPLLDAIWYRQTNLDLRDTPIDVARHYLEHGATEGRNPHPLFDTKFYLEQNPDVVASGMNPLKHYLIYGAEEGRDPSPRFSTAWYLGRYQDVARAKLNPLVHFLAYGQAEGRVPSGDGGLWTKIDACVRLFTETVPSGDPIIPLMLMQHHVEPDGRPFGYTATGSDPQLLINCRIPAGFFQLRIKIKYTNIGKSLVDQSSLQLFIGDEDGFRPGNVWTYAIKDGYVNVNDLLFNSKDIEYFRLDPLDTLGSFKIFDLEISPLQMESAIQEIVSSIKTAKIPTFDLSGNIRDLFSPDKLRNLVRMLSESEPDIGDPYEQWVRLRAIDAAEHARLVASIAKMKYRPTFSVLMPTYRSDLHFLDRAIASIHDQVYPHWELCIVDDGSGSPSLNALVEAWAARDSRIKFMPEKQNSGISQASNIALKAASGTFIALVDHDDEIAPHALYAAAAAINRHPNVDMLYTDEDKIDVDGKRFGPFFKPDWSPEFFLGCMYTCHLGIYRRNLVEDVGGFRPEFDLAQDYDLVFRVSARAREIVHIPDVLYHWRILENSTASGPDAKPMAEIRARQAVQEALNAEGLSGTVVEGPFRGAHRVSLDLTERPLISLVIPTAARRIDQDVPRWYLLDLLKSLANSTYSNLEIVIVHNGDMEPTLLEGIEQHNPILVEYESEIFNISEKINLGVDAAKGKYVILLNDDMTIITENWIEEMLMWFQRSGVVGVGAKLLFPNNTIQHAGVLLLAQGPSHVYYGSDDSEVGLAGSAVLARNYSAVTGACMMVRRSDFFKCGGFDVKLRVNYNDVDFCLRLGQLGRIIYTPYAMLYHYESVSKDESPMEELASFNARWDWIVGRDPYYNYHLSQRSSVNEVTSRPRSLRDDYP